MRSTGGGFTIIEVMLFIAISALLLVGALIAVGGQQAHTEFKTATNDVNTKFQQWIDQVVNGFTGSTASSSISNFTCDLTGTPLGSPHLVPGGTFRGANDQCVFLGKAIQVTDVTAPLSGSQNPQHIYAYSILGRRLESSSGPLVTNLVDAKPVASVDTTFPPNPDIDLIEDYVIPNGVRVLWVRNSATLAGLPISGTGSHLAGFYTSINGGASTDNGAQSLLAVQYPLLTNNDPRGSNVLKCISLQAPCDSSSFTGDASNPFPMNNWVICLQSTRNSDTAAIDIVSSSGNGVSTKVLIPCPGS